ncbi:helix-turn-helix transcriptional regulator [Paraburkholderia silviterrae]|nr:helix-turn-helix domain-containing protein [Paraburkholderia silviterrae]
MRNDVDLKAIDNLPDMAGVSAKIVAKLLGVHEVTVWTMTKRGALPAPVKIGGNTRWNVGALRKLLTGAA